MHKSHSEVETKQSLEVDGGKKLSGRGELGWDTGVEEGWGEIGN